MNEDSTLSQTILDEIYVAEPDYAIDSILIVPDYEMNLELSSNFLENGIFEGHENLGQVLPRMNPRINRQNDLNRATIGNDRNLHAENIFQNDLDVESKNHFSYFNQSDSSRVFIRFGGEPKSNE